MPTNQTTPATDEEILQKHKELLAQYQEKIESMDFNGLMATMTYQFISLEQRYDILDSYRNNPTRPIRFGFKSYESVLEFYKSLVAFKKDALDYFEKAKSIVELQLLAGEINLNVASSKTLSDSLKVSYPKDFYQHASNVITLLPDYVNLVNAQFVAVLLNSALHELSAADLLKLVDSRIINANSFYTLRPENSMGRENFYAIKNYMEEKGVQFESNKSFTIRLKGTSFNGKNGHNRQESLKLLDEFIKQGNTPELVLEQYEYTPELGIPEPAFNVMWGDRDIGNLPKEISLELANRYPMNVKTITGIKLSGGTTKNNGQNINYGIDILLDVNLLENETVQPQQENTPTKSN